MTLAEKYSKEVLKGKIVVGDYMKLSCKQFEKNLTRKDIYFDRKLADNIIKFCETILRFWEGQWRGEPVKIYPWQAFIIQNIFCWKYVKTDLRVIRSAYIEIARKNGKTTLAAIISFIHAFLDEDLTPQILVGANNEDQAKICTNTFAEMWEISPALADLIRQKQAIVRRYGTRARSVSFKYGKKNGYIEAMSKEVKSKDGFNPSLGIIDEFHEAVNDGLLNVIASGQAARKEPLLVVITTAGFNKYGVCYQRLRKSAINVLKGRTKLDSQFSAIYEMDEKDDWKRSSNWIKANPMIKHVDTIMPYLKVECKKAVAEGSTAQVNFQTKNLNRWTDSASVWIQDEIWIANHNPKLKKSDLDGLTCYGGLDLAATRDINAFNLLFPDIEIWGNKKHAVLLTCWLPEDNINWKTNNYTSFVEQGHIKTTPGNHSSPQMMLDDIKEASERYYIEAIHYDKYLAEWLAPQMAQHGIEIYPISMGGYNLSQTMKMMEIEIAKKKVEHFKNPVHRWALSNCEPKHDANGNIRPDKSNPENKIDPTVAMILSFDCWISSKGRENNADIMIL